MIGGIKLFDNVLTFAQPLLLEQLLLSLQEGKPAGEGPKSAPLEHFLAVVQRS